MSESNPPSPGPEPAQGQTATLPKPAPSKPKHLPQFKVLLHNDDVNVFEYVILTLMELTTLSEMDALKVTHEAHKQGLALVLVTHKERAELYVEQFASKSLTATLEPDA